MSDHWRGMVWGLGGYLKVLVYRHKFLPADEMTGRPEGYYDCVRIEEPKAKSTY